MNASASTQNTQSAVPGFQEFQHRGDLAPGHGARGVEGFPENPEPESVAARIAAKAGQVSRPTASIARSQIVTR